MHKSVKARGRLAAIVLAVAALVILPTTAAHAAQIDVGYRSISTGFVSADTIYEGSTFYAAA